MQSIFLVVEQDEFVADDLTQILQAVEPTAAIRTVRTLADAEAILSGDDRVDAAFIHASREDIIASALMVKLRARETGVVILNGEDLDHDPVHHDWTVVAVPFSSGMIESALITVRNRKG